MRGTPSKQQLAELIDRLYETHRNLDEGNLATYIPELGKADPRTFGIAITTMDGETLTVGDAASRFTIQSAPRRPGISRAPAHGFPEPGRTRRAWESTGW